MNGKLAVGALLVGGVLACAPSLGNFSAKADTIALDAADECFLEFISSDIGDEEINFSHSPLYDELLRENGRQYDFTVGGTDGYALLTEIMLNDGMVYEVEELFFDQSSPFDDCRGLPVYISHRTYLDFSDGVFYNALNGAIVGDETIDELVAVGFRYNEGTTANFTSVTQYASYSTKSEGEEYSIPYGLPDLYSIGNGTGCANSAGASIIAYYDRFYENLIPNYTSYTRIGPIIRYKSNTDESNNVINQLYALMSTDTQGAGTSFEGFQAGMKKYAQQNGGYSYTTTNVMSNGSLNFEAYKTSVKAGKPVALFLDGYAYLTSVTTNSGGFQDTIVSSYSNGTHVVVGCGYKSTTYINSLQTTTHYYLKIATGMPSYGIGYLNINGYGNIDKAISVTIS